MHWLNYHHLLYFWTVAREGTIARACDLLHVTQPTISGQLRSLERALGGKLFNRIGRNLVLTDMGRMVYRYADEIFSLGRELQDTLKGRPVGRPLQLMIGAADTVPKTIIYRLIEPALHLPEPVQIICDEGNRDQLFAQLAVNNLDVVLTDAPLDSSVNIRAFSHLLGECGVSILGTSKLAAAYRRGFPRSLNGAPFLLPGAKSTLRRSLEQWFDAEGIRPKVRGEFADSALIKVFGQHGNGLIAIPQVIDKEVAKLHQLHLVGRVESIRERFFAISVEKRLKHPAVVAISNVARQRLFG